MDQDYLRNVQYKDGRNLTARADLHRKYGVAAAGWFPWVVQQIDWPSGGDVLEVGCGTGWLWPNVQTPLRLTLTDLSAGMVAEAAERVAQRDNLTLVATHVADAQSLPFADDSFDLVIANYMLYHVPDIPQAVRELRRVLRPQGQLAAATNGEAHMRELDDVVTAVIHRPMADHATRFGTANGAAILGGAFDSVEWRGYDDELRCTDADDVVAYIESMSPGEVTPEQRAALRDEIEARMVDGVLRVSKETGLFLAR